MKKRITYLILDKNNSAKLPDDFVSFISVSKKEIVNGKRKLNAFCNYFYGGYDAYFDNEKFVEENKCLFVSAKKKTRWYRFLEWLRKRRIYYRVEYISSK